MNNLMQTMHESRAGAIKRNTHHSQSGHPSHALGWYGATGGPANFAPSRQKLAPASLCPSRLGTRSTDARAGPLTSEPSPETVYVNSWGYFASTETRAVPASLQQKGHVIACVHAK